MRKLKRLDWLALSAPAVASILVVYFYGHQKGWAAGITSGVLMFAFAVWIWRRQIIKYPDDTWKARLKPICPRRLGGSGAESLLMIGAVLGHSNARSTAIYAHISHNPARMAADRITAPIAQALGIRVPIEDVEQESLQNDIFGE